MAITYSFPLDTIDPRDKNKDWIKQYIQAAYTTSRGRMPGRLFFGQNDMNENIAYANGMPPITKYKKQYLGDEQNDSSWENIDWSPVNYLSKLVNIIVAKACQRGFDVQCFAVDPLSKSEEDTYFNEMKVKIKMNEAAEQVGGDIDVSAVLKPAPNEPQDMEQLKMEMDFGYKHVLAMEAEMGIQLVQQQNNFDERREITVRNIVNNGIGGYKTRIDENGNVKIYAIDPRNLILSYCRNPDFSDMVYVGEVIEVYLGEIAKYFSKDELIKIGEAAKGQRGNPMSYDYNNTNWYHACKVWVADMQFKSYNTTAYESRTDKSGNMRYGKTDFKNLASKDLPKSPEERLDVNETMTDDFDGSEPSYAANTRTVVYKGKWIIDTDYIYDYGLSENMVRKESSWWSTNLDFQIRAVNFDKMNFQGITRMLIPLQDQINLLWYKMQNLSAKLIPYIISLDMSALENVAYGKGGEPNNPKNITEFLFSNFTAIYRSQNLLNQSTQPMKPVSIDPSGQLYAFGELRNQLLMAVEQMKQVAGLNDITDASTPNSKNLNSTNEVAEMSTNNALYHIFKADEHLVTANADNVVMKLQIAVKLGKVEGIVRALGQETLKFIQINPNISMREFGIIAKVLPTEQQRMMLWQDVNMKESQGLLDVTDKELIMSTPNLKMAMIILGYRIKKRKEEMQQQELAKIQENNQGQQQMIAMNQQAQQATIEAQLQADLIRIQTQMQWQFQIEQMKKTVDYNAEMGQAEARNIGHQIQADAKIAASTIAAAGSVHKQSVANDKPQPKSKAKA